MCRLGETTKFELVSVSYGDKSKELNGFLGDHFHVHVTVMVDGQQNYQELKFFIKTLPKGEGYYAQFVSSTDAFLKEVAVYSDIFERFRKYGLIPRCQEEFPWAPQCYFTRSDVLVLEDLVAAGFELSDREEYMDYSLCELVLIALARFHAASIIYEEKESQISGKACKLNELCSDVCFEISFIRSGKSQLQFWFQTGVKTFLRLISMSKKYGEDSEWFGKILDSYQDKCELMFNYVQPSDKYRNVICHGDMWPSNLMFRYASDREKPVEVRLLDFQVFRYAPPALDVMMFLHMVTSREFRRDHLEKLLAMYHQRLESELQENDVPILQWEEFRESCNYYSGAARIMAPCFHQIYLVPTNILTPVLSTEDSFKKFWLCDRDTVAQRCFQEVPNYRTRLTEDIEEFMEYFFKF
ncbi:uncharacterized protein [Anabrus simplex]|uniref:uncharacterized protein n=1 Tax=Anabrus simplex TaxID=316456 RepID=UPI0035A2A250